ncbi:MAG TPA: HlyD family efflux transporter periplasmic adaptor subunit [Bacteroidia bacterium]|nr:HlyD family efflux transporter periplasmic adaptor subunit [Bacteroidia bacterium]
MKRFFLIGGALLVILLTIVFIKKGSSGEAIRVATENAERRDITEIVSASGKVQSENQVNVASDVSGEIVELKVKEGDTVRKGDLLLRVNPIIYQSGVDQMLASLNVSRANLANTSARLEQSKANLVNAEASFNRNKKLHEQKAISDAEFDQAKAQFESSKADVNAATESVKGASFNVANAEAALKQATDNLAKTTIYAPVSGTVAKLNKKKGEHVLGTVQMQGDIILVLANLNEMEVQVDVNENDILRVSHGDTVLIEVDAHNNRKFKGIVTEVANSANTNALGSSEQVTNFPVKIRILHDSYLDLLDPKNPGKYPFLPGMSATVEIQTKSVYNVVSVPIQSVTTRMDTAAKHGVEEAGELKKVEEENDDEEHGNLVVGDAKNKGNEKKAEKKAIECVFVYREGKVRLVPVKTGVQDNMYIEIVEGLKAGDEIVSAPYKRITTDLYNDATVEKVDKGELAYIED